MQKKMIAGLYRITKSEIEKASLVLGKAFHDEPVMSQAIPNEDEIMIKTRHSILLRASSRVMHFDMTSIIAAILTDARIGRIFSAIERIINISTDDEKIEYHLGLDDTLSDSDTR